MERKEQAQRPIDSLYAGVTDRIIAELEEGRLPWVRNVSTIVRQPDREFKRPELAALLVD